MLYLIVSSYMSLLICIKFKNFIYLSRVIKAANCHVFKIDLVVKSVHAITE